MLDCLILGDSIAVGVAQMRPACESAARVGINSSSFVTTMLGAAQRSVESVVISLGVNDGPAVATLSNLRRLRLGLQARQVTWLLPGLKDEVRTAIRTVAAEHGDRLVDTRPHVGADHLHPNATGYRLIAAATLGDVSPPVAVAQSPGLFHPAVALNPPQFLPMARIPGPHPSLQDGFPFRRWLPAGGVPAAPGFALGPSRVSAPLSASR